MVDIKRLTLGLVVAILLTSFVFTFVDAVYPQPEHDDFCDTGSALNPTVDGCDPVNVSPQDRRDCDEKDGRIIYGGEDENGCPTNYSCTTCRQEYDEARENHTLITFIITSVIGVLAIIAGLYIPDKSGWINEGILVAGLLILLIGTLRSFGDLGRIIRPIVLFVELLIVIWVGTKRLGYKDEKTRSSSRTRRK